MEKAKMNALLASGKAFVAKEIEDDKAQVSFDDLCDLARLAREEKSAAEKQYEQIKAELKKGLKARGLDAYENPNGVKISWSESQRKKTNEELMKELLGEDYSRVVSFVKEKRFNVK